LLDRAALERLERLALRWRQSFRGLLGGNNLSRYAGVGHEFLDHRHFHPGDDLRSVNWRAYLRLERLFLKMFQTEPRAPVRLWVDTSESMACGASAGSEGEPKFAYACRLAAALCYVGLVRLESMTIQPFSNSLADDFHAQGGRHRFAPASRFLEGLQTGGKSDFLAAVRQFLARKPQAGLLIVLSDFLDDGECARALQYLADHGQELLLVQLAGPLDRHPRWQGEFDLVDAESGEVLRLDLDSESLRQYEAAYEEHCQAIEYVAVRSGGRRLHLTTDIPLAEVLSTALIPAGSVSLH
jgi:uncharacterized protein (DUF58 family)